MDKIICDLNKTPDLSQRPPQNCPKYGNPVDGQYCQGCALLQKELKEAWFTICEENGILQGLLDTSKSSNDNTNVVNTSQELFVVKQDPRKNSSQSAHYGYNCLSKVSIILNPEPCNNQTIDELPQTLPSFDPTCYSGDGNSSAYDSKSNIVDDSPNYSAVHQPPQEEISVEFLEVKRKQINSVQTFLRKFNRISFYEMPKVLSLAWETILEIEHAFEDKHCQPEDILELFQRLHNDVQNIHEELAVYINTPSRDRPTIRYNNDGDEDYTIAITPILSTEEPDNSLRGIDEDILLTIKDDIIRKKLLNINLLIANIKAIKDNPTPYSDFMTKSSSTSLNFLLEETNIFDNSLSESKTFCFDSEENSSGSTTTRADICLPDYEAFHDDHVREISSGSTTTHSDFSLYDSFIFDLSINPFPPADRSDFYEFADELAHIISPPKYDCFCFKNEPNSGDFTMDVVEDIFPTR
nr:hypothetical protein [Tanacetum cinerariifolium]